MRRATIFLLLLTLCSCAARTGVVTLIYANGDVIAGEDFYKPEVKGSFVVFEKKDSVTITPFIHIFEAYWFEGMTVEELQEKQQEGESQWRLGS